MGLSFSLCIHRIRKCQVLDVVRADGSLSTDQAVCNGGSSAVALFEILCSFSSLMVWANKRKRLLVGVI